MNKLKSALVSFFSVIIILGLWQYISVQINASVIVPSPVEVFKSLIGLFSSEAFLRNISVTILRALESFVIIVVSGFVLGVAAGSSCVVENMIKPFVTLFKAVPVMSVILIAFLWMKTGQIPVFSAFLMAFPIMYVQVLSGMKSRSNELIQMCEIYEIKGFRKLVDFTLPSLVPAFVTGAKQSLSMIWKVVIAAEVLIIPKYGVGMSLHMAQIQLETAEVFAWTIVAVLLTWIGDSIFSAILKRVVKRREA